MRASLLALVALLLTACAQQPARVTKIIEWGWDTPRLQKVEAVLPAAQTLLLDGMVIDVQTPLDGRGLSWTLFADTPVNEDTLLALAHDYANLEWGRLTDNFLRLTVFPANVDWFEDWGTIEANATAWARLARELGFIGILLDVEQYEQMRLFEYAAQPQSTSHSFDDYAKQAVERGRRFMDALESGFPGLTIILTYALTVDPGTTLIDPKTSRYGLLVPFVEGMAVAADSGSTLVDGYEHSYIYKGPQEFEQAAGRIRDVNPRYVDRASWSAPHVGFGLWIDPVCGNGGLPESGCGFSRAEFYTALSAALHNTDRYVWIYSQHINWYTGAGIPGDWMDMLRGLRSTEAR